MKDYYFILGISTTAGSHEIKEAFRKLCLKYHPDVAPTTPHNQERYMDICEAYKVLSSRERREEYDAKAAAALHGQSVKGGFTKIKDAIYPEIKTSYKGHYPWYAVFALLIVASLAIAFFFNMKKTNFAAATHISIDTPEPIAPKAIEAKPVNIDSVSNVVVADTSPATKMLTAPPVTNPADTLRITKAMVTPPAPTLPEARPSDKKADSAKKVEAFILSSLAKNTPRQIERVKAIPGRVGVVPYKEKNYQYSFSDGKLIVTYTSDLQGKVSRNQVVIPAKDIQTVYYSNNKIWINSRKKSIRINDLSNGKKQKTEFFCVKFNAEDGKLAHALQQLKTLYRP